MTKQEAIRHIMDVIAENNSIKPNIVTFEQEKEALYMAIEALSEDISEDGTLKVKVKDGSKVNRVLVWGDNHFGGLYYPE